LTLQGMEILFKKRRTDESISTKSMHKMKKKRRKKARRIVKADYLKYSKQAHQPVSIIPHK